MVHDDSVFVVLSDLPDTVDTVDTSQCQFEESQAIDCPRAEFDKKRWEIDDMCFIP